MVYRSTSADHPNKSIIDTLQYQILLAHLFYSVIIVVAAASESLES